MAQSRRKGRPGAALLVSVAVHGVLLFLLARAVPVLPNIVREPPFQIELVPTLSPSSLEAPAVSRTAPAAAAPVVPPLPERATRQRIPPRPASPQRPATRPIASRPVPARPAPPRPAPAPPSAPGARAAPPSASRPAVGEGSGQTAQAPASQGAVGATRRAPASLPGDEYAGGVRHFLRETVGCSHQDFVRLTVAERAECERQNGVQASIGAHQHMDAIPAGKRVYYDSVQQAYQEMHHYETPLDTGAGGQGASAPGHGPSFGCIHGKCGLISPEGVLTEESGTDPH